MSKPITIRILGDSSGLGKSLGKAQGKLAKFGKFAVKAGAVLGTAMVGGAGISIKAFADFDQAMTQSTAIMGDLSDSMKKKMSDAARTVAKTTKFSATESAESYFYLASAGMDAEQSIAALPKVAAFAQAGMFDMATATDLATDAQSALGLSVKDPAKNLENLTRVTDVFVKSNTLANTSVEQIAEAMTSGAGAAAKVVGKDIEEVSAVLSAFADQGIKGAEAGTQYGIVMRDLQTKALDNKEAFKEMGVAVFDNNGEMRHMGDIVADLETGLQGMSDAEMKSALLGMGFSDKSVKSLQTLLGASDAIHEYDSALRDSTGFTKNVAEKQMQTFWAQFGLLKDRIMDVAITIGSVLVPLILKGADKMEKGFSKVSDWWSKNGPQIIDSVIGIKDAIVGWIREVGPPIRSWVRNVLGEVSDWWSSNGPTVIRIAEGMRDVLVNVFRKLQTATNWAIDNWNRLRTPLTVVAGLLTAVVAPAFVIVATQAKIAAVKVALANAAKAHSTAVATAKMSAAIVVQVAKWALLGVQSLIHAGKVAAAWLIAMGPIGLVIAAVAGAVALIIIHFDTIKETISKAWEWVKSTTSKVWAAILRFLSDTWAKVQSVVSGAVDAVKGAISGGMDSVKGAWSRAWDAVKGKVDDIKNAIQGVLDGFVGFIQGIPGRVSNSLSSLFQPLADGFDTVIGTIRRAWNSFARFWNGISIDIPEVNIPGVGSLGGGSFSLPDLPTFAKGAVVTEPTLGIFGEYPGAKGNPEIATPEKLLRQIIREERGAAGSDAPTIIEQHFHGFSTDEAKRLAKEGTNEALKAARQRKRKKVR